MYLHEIYLVILLQRNANPNYLAQKPSQTRCYSMYVANRWRRTSREDCCDYRDRATAVKRSSSRPPTDRRQRSFGCWLCAATQDSVRMHFIYCIKLSIYFNSTHTRQPPRVSCFSNMIDCARARATRSLKMHRIHLRAALYAKLYINYIYKPSILMYKMPIHQRKKVRDLSTYQHQWSVYIYIIWLYVFLFMHNVR